MIILRNGTNSPRPGALKRKKRVTVMTTENVAKKYIYKRTNGNNDDPEMYHRLQALLGQSRSPLYLP